MSQDNREHTGGSVNYYRVRISGPTSGGDAYTAECNDIIEALGMNYAEGNAFKALWRRAAARTLGLSKKGYDDDLYDAEKVEFFGKRLVEQSKNRVRTNAHVGKSVSVSAPAAPKSAIDLDKMGVATGEPFRVKQQPNPFDRPLHDRQYTLGQEQR